MPFDFAPGFFIFGLVFWLFGIVITFVVALAFVVIAARLATRAVLDELAKERGRHQ